MQSIPNDVRDRLDEYTGGIVRNMDAKLLAIGGTADHVHLLLSLRTDRSLAEVMRTLKTNTSKWIHETFPTSRDFAWQSGYAAFTVSHSAVDQVTSYIADQERHHATWSFDDELEVFLNRHGVAYDPSRLRG